MPCRVIDNRPARSVAVLGPCSASEARIARRLGSASAAKTPAETSSGSGGIEVLRELVELRAPALDVPLVARLQPLVRQLSEAALGDRESSAGRSRLEDELDVGLPRVALGSTGDPPAEGENRHRVDNLDRESCRRVVLLPAHPHLVAGSHLSDRVAAEPAGDAVEGGQRGPDFLLGMREVKGASDRVRDGHDQLLIATVWLRSNLWQPLGCVKSGDHVARPAPGRLERAPVTFSVT